MYLLTVPRLVFAIESPFELATDMSSASTTGWGPGGPLPKRVSDEVDKVVVEHSLAQPRQGWRARELARKGIQSIRTGVGDVWSRPWVVSKWGRILCQAPAVVEGRLTITEEPTRRTHTNCSYTNTGAARRGTRRYDERHAVGGDVP